MPERVKLLSRGEEGERGDPVSRVSLIFSRFFGLSIFVVVCLTFGYYMYILHETRLWFSNIRQVEKEISFRTETGLYYSYFKQVLQEPNLGSALKNLLSDKLTEAPNEINLLQRLNIYQEVFIALLFKLISYITVIEPILFYTYFCFFLSGFGVGSVFLLSWEVSGNFLFGLLTSAWTFADVDDATRVFFTVNLRENFALPFFWLQNLYIIKFLKSSEDEKSLPGFHVAFFTFVFSLFWQFNQFILLLQNVTLVLVSFVFSEKYSLIIKIFVYQLVAFVFLFLFQFFQPMLMESLFVYFTFSAILVLYLNPPNTNWKKSILNFLLIVILSFALLNIVKVVLQTESDSHIWTFVKSKLGFPLGKIPFETALYICHGAFAFIDYGFFERCSQFGMFHLYCISALVVVGLCVKKFFSGKLETHYFDSFLNPEIVFVCGQSILTGIMAVLTLRMKYVWFPQVAVLGAHFIKIGDKFIGKYPKYAVIMGIIYLALTKQYGIYKQQIANEQVGIGNLSSIII